MGPGGFTGGSDELHPRRTSGAADLGMRLSISHGQVYWRPSRGRVEDRDDGERARSPAVSAEALRLSRRGGDLRPSSSSVRGALIGVVATGSDRFGRFRSLWRDRAARCAIAPCPSALDSRSSRVEYSTACSLPSSPPHPAASPAWRSRSDRAALVSAWVLPAAVGDHAGPYSLRGSCIVGAGAAVHALGTRRPHRRPSPI